MPLIKNYKNLFSTQYEIKKQLKILCPELDDKPGIYFWFREDHEGKHIYIGQATKNLTDRSISHCMGYTQRLDISIKKRGFYSQENKLGWQLKVMHFPVEQLNEKEKYYIDLYVQLGYDVYNIESGSKVGKYDIAQRKEGRGYHDGLKQGHLNAQKEVANWFEKSLDYSIKGNPTVNKQKAYDRFTEFLKVGNKEDIKYYDSGEDN